MSADLAIIGTALAGLAAIAYSSNQSLITTSAASTLPTMDNTDASKSLGYSLSLNESILHIKQIGYKYGVVEFQNLTALQDTSENRQKILKALKEFIVYRAFSQTRYSSFSFNNEPFLLNSDSASFIIFISKTLYELDIRIVGS